MLLPASLTVVAISGSNKPPVKELSKQQLAPSPVANKAAAAAPQQQQQPQQQPTGPSSGNNNNKVQRRHKSKRHRSHRSHRSKHRGSHQPGGQHSQKHLNMGPHNMARQPSSKSVHTTTSRLKKDGRMSPDQYRALALNAPSPSQLSFRTITEFYTLQPNTNFVTTDDVYKYRGYKKLNKIDEGAFGIVSKAVRVADKLVVAIKEVDLRRKRAKRIEEMKRELFCLQKIDSENVVRLVEHFVVGQMLVIILEFCAGGNLTSYLKEKAINEEEAIFLFKQMAYSVSVLHKKGIAHRDVKLNNFLLDGTRRLVKIADFGLSVVSYRPSYGVLMAKTYCGTEPYMAPEILKRNSIGVRSYNPLYADVWSLGVCLFAMLTRTFPFKMHTTQQELYKAQVTRKWRFPKSLRDLLSEELKDIAWHMLDPEPERRISITGILTHPWLVQYQLVPLTSEATDTESVSTSATNASNNPKPQE